MSQGAIVHSSEPGGAVGERGDQDAVSGRAGQDRMTASGSRLWASAGVRGPRARARDYFATGAAGLANLAASIADVRLHVGQLARFASVQPRIRPLERHLHAGHVAIVRVVRLPRRCGRPASRCSGPGARAGRSPYRNRASPSRRARSFPGRPALRGRRSPSGARRASSSSAVLMPAGNASPLRASGRRPPARSARAPATGLNGAAIQPARPS